MTDLNKIRAAQVRAAEQAAIADLPPELLASVAPAVQAPEGGPNVRALTARACTAMWQHMPGVPPAAMEKAQAELETMLLAAIATQPLATDDLELCRQWFNSMQDTNGGYLDRADYALAERLYRMLGQRVPNSITEPLGLPAAQPKPTRSQRLADAGFTRRPSWRSLPKDGDDDEPSPAEVDEFGEFENFASEEGELMSLPNAWAKDRLSGEYVYAAMRTGWRAWKARAALANTQPKGTPAGWSFERAGDVIKATAPDGIYWCVVRDDLAREDKIGAFFWTLCDAIAPAPKGLTSVCHMECDGCIDAGKCAFPGKAAEPARYPHPDEDDAVTLWAEIHRLRAAVQGPDGYATWQEAATAERVRRVAAEKAMSAVPSPAVAPKQALTAMQARHVVGGMGWDLDPTEAEDMEMLVKAAERACAAAWGVTLADASQPPVQGTAP
jgi:hypothetical protein